jgi:hypothetical protein
VLLDAVLHTIGPVAGDAAIAPFQPPGVREFGVAKRRGPQTCRLARGNDTSAGTTPKAILGALSACRVMA